jgi:hypothetical protein
METTSSLFVCGVALRSWWLVLFWIAVVLVGMAFGLLAALITLAAFL